MWRSASPNDAALNYWKILVEFRGEPGTRCPNRLIKQFSIVAVTGGLLPLYALEAHADCWWRATSCLVTFTFPNLLSFRCFYYRNVTFTMRDGFEKHVIMWLARNLCNDFVVPITIYGENKKHFQQNVLAWRLAISKAGSSLLLLFNLECCLFRFTYNFFPPIFMPHEWLRSLK